MGGRVSFNVLVVCTKSVGQKCNCVISIVKEGIIIIIIITITITKRIVIIDKNSG